MILGLYVLYMFCHCVKIFKSICNFLQFLIIEISCYWIQWFHHFSDNGNWKVVTDYNLMPNYHTYLLFWNKWSSLSLTIIMSSLENFVMFAKDQDSLDALINLKGCLLSDSVLFPYSYQSCSSFHTSVIIDYFFA